MIERKNVNPGNVVAFYKSANAVFSNQPGPDVFPATVKALPGVLLPWQCWIENTDTEGFSWKIINVATGDEIFYGYFGVSIFCKNDNTGYWVQYDGNGLPAEIPNCGVWQIVLSSGDLTLYSDFIEVVNTHAGEYAGLYYIGCSAPGTDISIEFGLQYWSLFESGNAPSFQYYDGNDWLAATPFIVTVPKANEEVLVRAVLVSASGSTVIRQYKVTWSQAQPCTSINIEFQENLSTVQYAENAESLWYLEILSDSDKYIGPGVLYQNGYKQKLFAWPEVVFSTPVINQDIDITLDAAGTENTVSISSKHYLVFEIVGIPDRLLWFLSLLQGGYNVRLIEIITGDYFILNELTSQNTKIGINTNVTRFQFLAEKSHYSGCDSQQNFGLQICH